MGKRFFAWVIDGLMVVGLGGLFNGLGWAAGVGYWLLRDGLFEGQSVGKRLMGLKVVVHAAGRPCTYRDSIIRNVLCLVPVVNVFMAFSIIAAAVKGVEGRHWGDRLADTRVVPVT